MRRALELRRPIVAVLLVASFLSGCGGPAAVGPSPAAPAPVAPTLPPISGAELAKKVRANLDVPYESLTYRMELIDSRGAGEQRKAAFHRASNLDGKDCAYTCFLEPQDIQGFGLLTLRAGDAEPEQFLYVPASRKVSRILYFSTNRRSSFCGTQYTFEDLEPLRLADFEFSVTGTARTDGRDCYLLQSLPRTRFSGYSKVLSHVDEKTSLVLRSVFYDPRGELLKIGASHELFEAMPGHWRARKLEMANRQTDRVTRLELVDYRCTAGSPTTADRQVFTLATLSGGREK
ncbi:MAG: outer membrane lipoprotein-sorting protein [Candidatus Wallbacteria bacterium]|nr:outer membrane lipoprotein-sorting protein [Candidatus Wallbacteria bacterium]